MKKELNVESNIKYKSQLGGFHNNDSVTPNRSQSVKP